MGTFENTGLAQLARVKITQIEMLRDRGYSTYKEELALVPSDEANLADSIRLFSEYFDSLRRERGEDSFSVLDRIYTKPDARDIHVYYLATAKSAKTGSVEGKVDLEQIRATVGRFEDEKVAHAIFISEYEINTAGLEVLSDLPAMVIERFTFRELGYNVTKHAYVPRHRLLNEQETRELLSREGVSRAVLPAISFQDPVARYFGANLDDIFEILQVSIAAESFAPITLYWRRVTSQPLFVAAKGKKSYLPFMATEKD